MTLFSAEEARQFEDSVDEFVDDHNACEAGSLWQAIAGLGWLNLTIPEANGGMGGGLSELVVLQRGCGRALLSEPLMFTVGMAVPLLLRVATVQQRVMLLPRIADGKLRLATGFGHSSCECVYERNGSESVLRGMVPAVHGAASADHILARARSNDPDALFLIDPHDARVELKRFTLVDGSEAADLILNDVRIPPSQAFVSPFVADACADAMHRGMILASAEAVGAMEALVKMTIDYAKVRTQFGKRIGSFQVIQHRLVDMTITTRRARSLVDAAACAVDGDATDTAWLAAACKVVASRAGRLIGEQAVQIHGGIGMSEEYPVGRYFRRLIKLGGLFGGGEDHLSVLAAATWKDQDHDLVL